MPKIPTMRVLVGCAFVLAAAGCSSTTAGHSVHSSAASSTSGSASTTTPTTQAAGGASGGSGGGAGGGGGGSVTTPRSSSQAPIPTPTTKPSPTTPVISIAGVTATFNSNNPAFVHVAGTYTCTSGTGNLRLGLTHNKNGIPNEYDGPTPGDALKCTGAAVAFGPTTLTLDGGNDTWTNQDPVTVQVIFKFADGSTQEQSTAVKATGS
jgi:hypothetical protein